MKVLHVPFCFYPDPVGGTEVYVNALAHELEALGVETVITAPGDREVTYEYEGLRVRRYAVSLKAADLRELYGEGDPTAALGFARILDEERPGVVHLHAFTRGVSLRLVREAKLRELPVVFTYHTPTVSCLRGTLMRWGTEACDGVLRSGLCTACTLHGLGVPWWISQVVSRLPGAVGRGIALARLSGGAWTALRMRELVELRHLSFRSLMTEVDHVIALCQWTKELLMRNGVPAEKITLVRHGVPQIAKCEVQRAETGEQSLSSGRLDPLGSVLCPMLRVAALGRLDPTKGFDVLIRAIRALPDASIQLDIYGVAQGEAGDQYAAVLQRLAGNDPRIRLLGPISKDELRVRLSTYDLVAVPSQCLETGPMVVLEALAAGVPVLGSKLGGIAEWVENGVNGLLVEPAEVEGWKQVLGRIVQDRRLLTRLRAGIRPPRSMADVARETVALYRELQEEAP